MNNVKYRYWNGYSLQCVSYMRWNRKDELIEFGNDANKITADKFDDNVLEQYTGLQDINDTEICEGDILATSSLISGKQVTDYLEVNWREDYGGFYSGEKPLFACLSDWDNDIKCPQTFPKIIGNIHENPELMEASHED